MNPLLNLKGAKDASVEASDIFFEEVEEWHARQHFEIVDEHRPPLLLPEASGEDHQPSGVGMLEIAEFLALAARNAPYIISVGCGSGRHEQSLCKVVPGLKDKLLLVDPDPLTFDRQDKVHMKIDYPTVSDLVASRPEVVQNCILLLIWPDFEPEPEPESEAPAAPAYDFEAFELLNPIGVVALWERQRGAPAGASASDRMGDLLDGRLSPQSHDYERIVDRSFDQKNQGFWGTIGGFEWLRVKLTWIARRGTAVPEDRMRLIYDTHYNTIDDYELDSFDVDSC